MSVEIVHRRRGDPDVDPDAVLAHPFQFHVADRLALEGALEQRLRLRLAFGRHENEGSAERLLRGIAEHPLGAAVPDHHAPLAAGADDGDRRRVDHGGERVLGFSHLVGGGASLFLAAFERLCHPIEVFGERSDLVAGVDRAAMAQFPGCENRCVPAELPQRANDTAGQHPGDGEGRQQRAGDEQRGPSQAPHDGREGDVGRQADRHEPWRRVSGCGAGDALDAIRPNHDFADVLGGEVPHDLLGLADVARDPVRPINVARDHDSLLVDDRDHAPGRQLLDPQRVLEMLQDGAGHQDGAQSAGPILDRARDADDQLLALAAADDVADDQALTCQYLSKIFAIIDRRPYRLVRPGPDIGAVGRK